MASAQQPQQTAAKPPLPPSAIDGGHMDAEVVTAAAAAATAKAAAAAAKPVRANVKCPCPNCRAAAAGAPGAKGSFSYGKTVGGSSGGGGGGRPQQQQAAAGKSGGKQQDQKASPSCIAFNVTALPAKPLMHAATSKEVEKAKPKALQARRDSFRTRLQKLAARLVKRKKE